MKGVILAAGYGSRFALGEGRLHKLLLRIGNRAVIDYTLEAFGKAGIRDVAMVVGYRAELLRDYNGDGARHGIHLKYLFNPQYERGNALSQYRKVLHPRRAFLAFYGRPPGLS